MAWELQNKLKKKDIPSWKEILEYVDEISNERVRALFAIIYLTGCRITEALCIQKRDIKLIEKNGKKIMLVTLLNEKNKQRKIKKIPINIEKEYPLVKAFLEYVDKVEGEDVFGNLTKRYAYKIIRKHIGINPHFIRHIRLTHLITEFDFNEEELRIFAGWTDTRPARNYIEMRWTDLLRKL